MYTLDVSGEIALLRECPITMATAVRSITSVHAAMASHVTGYVRIVITYVTLVSALSADMTVLILDMDFQLLFSNALIGTVVAA